MTGVSSNAIKTRNRAGLPGRIARSTIHGLPASVFARNPNPRTRIDMTHPHRIPSPFTRPLRRALAAALLVIPTTAAAQQGPLEGLAAYVQQGMRDWEVPGLALAVVKDDSVVFARGFGTRTLGRDEPVDEHTSFAIASTTKAFTATAIAMLVDEGKVRWDDPVSVHVPGFQLADPGLASELTVRDLLTHRTGLPNSDFLWYASGSSTEEILRRMRFMRPFASPRSRYQYNNNAYMLAGQVVQSASGMPWGEFVRRRILEPLGMRETLTGYVGLDGRGNVATPHQEVEGTIRPTRYLNFDNIGPAGSMNSSVHDVARWIRFQLAGGEWNGQRLVSEAQHREMLTPQFVIPPAQYYPAARLARPNFTAYGLGWFMQDYRGRKLAMHTGSIDGMTALVAMVPEERLGLVVFINLDHAELRHALMYRIIDAYLGGPPRDWSAELRPLYQGVEDRAEAARRERESRRVQGTRPSLPLDAYAGIYVDPDSLAGRVTVSVQDGRLMVSAAGGAMTGAMEHWHYDVFRVRWADEAMGTGFMVFTIDPEGRVAWARADGRPLTRVREAPAASQ
jgi:CubicO group peptidase (beta-lactamase class C family)